MKSEGDSIVLPKKINMKSLKKFAVEKLPQSSLLKTVLTTEKEYLTILEFLAKIDIWLKILDNENRIELKS
jgi:hypothetical protein